VTWYHVELESHDVLLAEGAAAESWLDCENRAWFENAPVAQLATTASLSATGSGWDASARPVLIRAPRTPYSMLLMPRRSDATERAVPNMPCLPVARHRKA
jgi:hypothetical protein